jgi:hypothetical protein
MNIVVPTLYGVVPLPIGGANLFSACLLNTMEYSPLFCEKMTAK